MTSCWSEKTAFGRQTGRLKKVPALLGAAAAAFLNTYPLVLYIQNFNLNCLSFSLPGRKHVQSDVRVSLACRRGENGRKEVAYAPLIADCELTVAVNSFYFRWWRRGGEKRGWSTGKTCAARDSKRGLSVTWRPESKHALYLPLDPAASLLLLIPTGSDLRHWPPLHNDKSRGMCGSAKAAAAAAAGQRAGGHPHTSRSCLSGAICLSAIRRPECWSRSLSHGFCPPAM